jgi:glycosyltransferase involved in cell wall biosynthesis
MSHSGPEYSIIIPSFNRSDELQELLASISTLDFPKEKFEVIISDDGSTDNTSQLVQSIIAKQQFNLRFITQENKGPGTARNHGMQNARGTFFIFLDSDVTVADDWLMKIDQQLKSNKAEAYGGPDSYRDDFPALLKAINYSMTSFITTGGLRGKKGKKLAKFYPRSFNMGLSKTLWQEIGGFGSLRHGQDIEFSHRIIKSGAKVLFIDAAVFHKRRTNLKRFYKQVFNWGVARINLYKLDEDMLEILHAVPAFITLLTISILVLAVFFKVFQFILWAGIILGVLIFIFSAVDSIIKYKSFQPLFWLPLVMPAQIFGYGLGFIYNFARRVIFHRGEKTGFKKNYYK